MPSSPSSRRRHRAAAAAVPPTRSRSTRAILAWAAFCCLASCRTYNPKHVSPSPSRSRPSSSRSNHVLVAAFLVPSTAPPTHTHAYMYAGGTSIGLANIADIRRSAGRGRRTHRELRTSRRRRVLLAASRPETNTDASVESPSASCNRTVTILSRGNSYVIASKPPSVVCHHSGWTGSRSKAKRGEEPEVPMLQRVRDGMASFLQGDTESGSGISTRKRVNVVHRLDRGASGCLLVAYAGDDEEDEDANTKETDVSREDMDFNNDGNTKRKKKRSATAILQEAMASPNATKTYLALVRGEGILKGEDLQSKGWFAVDRPIKDEKKRLNDATTYLRFVAGQPEDASTGQPRASLVLARPVTGRWHQVRKHLNGLSHPILGDTTHGSNRANHEWKAKRGMKGERTCLHLARMELAPNELAPEGIDVCCPLEADMMRMLEEHMPKVLEEALPILKEEGIRLRPDRDDEDVLVLPYNVPDVDLERRQAVAKLNALPIPILSQGDHYVVVEKPPTIVCHHSAWTGRRSDERRLLEPTPMLQRVRDLVGRRVNLIHRLDRGASGCLILSYADEEKDLSDDRPTDNDATGATKALMEAMGSSKSVKTYVALVKGDGFCNGEDLVARGWFTVNDPVKNENGKLIDGSYTDLRFVGRAALNDKHARDPAGANACLVLARPRTGRWHQVRQHLANSVGHPILGDSTHGLSRTNRIWREKRGMMKQRVCLHLASVELPPTEFAPEGIGASCPLPRDMLDMLETYTPAMLESAKHILDQDGIEMS